MIDLPIKSIASLVLLAGILLAIKLGANALVNQGKLECQAEIAQAVAAESKRQSEALSEVSREAQRMQSRVRADADLARNAADRVRGAVAGNGLVLRSAAATGSAPTSETERLSSELLRSATEIARFADESHLAGTSCEASYDALRR